MRSHVGVVADVVLIVAAVAVVIALFRDPTGASGSVPQGIEAVDNWDELRNAALWSGDSNATLQILEFSDMECPACRSFQPRLDMIRERYGGHVAVGLIHYPLPQHRFARISARVLECAAANDGDDPGLLVNVLYAKQDSMGLKPWPSYLEEAGVTNIDATTACVQSDVQFDRIEKGLALGRDLNIGGTPTFVVNGWLVPPNSDFESTVAEIVATGRPAQ